MAYCSKCGAQIKGNFCSNCGNAVNGINVQQNMCNTESGVYTVGDFTYTDEDLKYYENKLNAEIAKLENSKIWCKILYVAGGIQGIYTLFSWNTDGFWNEVSSHCALCLTGFLLLMGFISMRSTNEKIEKLKQYNPYSYMMKHKADEEKWRAVGEGLQAFNNGMRTMNNAYKIGQFLGRL